MLYLHNDIFLTDIIYAMSDRLKFSLNYTPQWNPGLYAPDDVLIHTVFFPVVFSRKALADYSTMVSLIFHFLRSQYRECNRFPIRK